MCRYDLRSIDDTGTYRTCHFGWQGKRNDPWKRPFIADFLGRLIKVYVVISVIVWLSTKSAFLIYTLQYKIYQTFIFNVTILNQ